MKIGVQAFSTDQGVGPTRLAEALEERGFAALFLTEHTHIPVSRKTAHPSAGTELPEHYARTWDPYVALGAVSAVTSELAIGTGISLLGMRDPLITAKSIASLDRLSDGRFIFGTAFGWNRDEAENHPGAAEQWPMRHAVIREKVELMRAVWSQEVASYEGEYVHLTPSWVWPKPVRPGGPRVFVGGTGPKAMREAAAWADAWYATPDADERTMETKIGRFRRLVEEADRDPSEVGVAIAAAPPDPNLLEAYRDQGVELVNLSVTPKAEDEMLRLLDDWQKLVEAFGEQ
jgi:probable F420-dependent oxidoreductase